jgi:hypothetical protein
VWPGLFSISAPLQRTSRADATSNEFEQFNIVPAKLEKKMKIILLAISLMMVAAANGQDKSIKASADPKAEQELRRLEREWLNADAAAIERIEADDFTITYEDGSVRNKAAYLEMVRQRKVKPNGSEWTEDSQVRVYGNTAIINGKFLYKFRDSDKEIVNESRYTDTYIRRNGRWQDVASHLSSIAKGR